MKNFILFVSFFIFQYHNNINCAQQENYNIRDLMHKAITIDRDFTKIEQYLQEGYVLAQYYTNKNKFNEGHYQRQIAERWLHQYFTYPQTDGSSKNLMQLFLAHERTYSRSDKRSDFFKIGQAILQYGVDVNTLNNNGSSIVHCISKLLPDQPNHHDHLDFFNHLIAAGADVNLKNKHGDTPTHFALQTNQSHDFIVSMLCAGGNLHEMNSFGKTPLDYASPDMKRFITLYPILCKKTCSESR